MNRAVASAEPRILRPWQAAVLIVAVLIVVGATYSSTRTHAEVRVAHPAYGEVASTVETTGAVEPVNDFPARANFSGLVDRIYVHLGEKVRVGQRLLELKDQYAIPRLEKARADLKDAELNEQNVLHNGSLEDRIGSAVELQKATMEQKQAAAAWKATQQLAKRGDVSPAEVEAAQQRLAVAKVSLKALQQKLHERYSPEDLASWKVRVAADKASVAAEEVSYRNSDVTSPIAGTVYVLPTQLWDFVSAGTALLHVADLSKIHVRAEFDEPDIAKLHVGAPVTITWDGLPGRVWHGHVQQKPLAVDNANGLEKGLCYVSIEDDHGQLPVNTTVAVRAVIQKRARVLTIPRAALYGHGGSQFVYRVKDEMLEKTPVQTGLASAMRIEIISGLTPGDLIVMHAETGKKLRDGLKVKIVK